MANVIRFGSDGSLMFFCPGCECGHGVPYRKVRVLNDPNNPRPAGVWDWNGSEDKPSLFPSLLLKGQCHSWVKDGKIQFLNDSAHKLKAKTVDLPDFDV